MHGAVKVCAISMTDEFPSLSGQFFHRELKRLGLTGGFQRYGSLPPDSDFLYAVGAAMPRSEGLVRS